MQYLKSSKGVNVEPTITSLLQWGGVKKFSPPQRMHLTATRNYSTVEYSKSWWKWLPHWEMHLCCGVNQSSWHGCKVTLYWSLWNHLPAPFTGRALFRVDGRIAAKEMEDQHLTQRYKFSEVIDWGLRNAHFYLVLLLQFKMWRTLYFHAVSSGRCHGF